MEKLEENLAKIALHFGRYIVTMMSTGVILLSGFSFSGGDGQMNDLIWYSWVGGIIIGTMIGSNMVLDEVSRAGPRNVVITGSTRGLGKALAREFLLSGDRVVIASRSEKSVKMTIKELEENLHEGMATEAMLRITQLMLSTRKSLGICLGEGEQDHGGGNSVVVEVWWRQSEGGSEGGGSAAKQQGWKRSGGRELVKGSLLASS
ncbi:hypothetical protein QVD17_13930 [Tagetes erecta]|uniref:Uncharacterized protein n=1 Tax=Tagetes erecta TaxID=13708 RepID=A0AAD8P3R0_TARER|nr:hypothetical protein QVD17_13930 [Tagetes erecta]